MVRKRLTRVAALLFTPVVALSSVHELYLRNQQELDRTVSALYPFWISAGVAVVFGAFLHDENVAEPDVGELHEAAFLRPWAFRTLPLGLSKRAARSSVFGVRTHFFELEDLGRLSSFALLGASDPAHEGRVLSEALGAQARGSAARGTAGRQTPATSTAN